MSFTLPIIIVKSYLSSSRETLTGIPEWISRRLNDKTLPILLTMFVLFCAINQAVNSPSKFISLLSPSASWALIILSIWLWRRLGSEESLRKLLPTEKEILLLFPLLVFMYVLLKLRLFSEGIPPMKEQIGAWLLYIIFGTLLYLDVKTPVTKVSLPVVGIPRSFLLYSDLW
ncbi:hypothetical protein ADU37_CDS07010 [Thermococcus sp. 2319x1]|nr:hypothetical protein ADU37_CDS07010 [Thermococcus sp. 2319x1]